MAPSEDRRRKPRQGAGDKQGDDVITIKKYANRRLYNTATSSYVTLDHLCQMVKQGVEFAVYDAKTGEDITRTVLTQIIVEEEAKGQNLLPLNFLRQLISFYGDNMQFVVPRYLEQMMAAFAANQERVRQSMGNMFPFGNLEEMGRQNVAMIEQAMKMFSPFPTGEGKPPASGGGQQQPDSSPDSSTGASAEESLERLQHQVDLLRQELARLSEPEPSTQPKRGESATGKPTGRKPGTSRKKG